MRKACSVCRQMIAPVRLARSPRARTCGLQGCQEEHHLRQERTAARGPPAWPAPVERRPLKPPPPEHTTNTTVC